MIQHCTQLFFKGTIWSFELFYFVTQLSKNKFKLLRQICIKIQLKGKESQKQIWVLSIWAAFWFYAFLHRRQNVTILFVFSILSDRSNFAPVAERIFFSFSFKKLIYSITFITNLVQGGSVQDSCWRLEQNMKIMVMSGVVYAKMVQMDKPVLHKETKFFIIIAFWQFAIFCLLYA